MKTIILYASKYGAAQEIAQRIANKLPGGDACEIYNIKDTLPALDSFDRIIFGSSVYAGSIREEAKTFLANNEKVMMEKTLGLFLSGIGTDGKDSYFKSNFPENILQKAKARGFLGGAFDPKKANFMERLIIRIVSKKSGLINTINDRKIEKFAEEIKT